MTTQEIMETYGKEISVTIRQAMPEENDDRTIESNEIVSVNYRFDGALYSSVMRCCDVTLRGKDPIQKGARIFVFLTITANSESKEIKLGDFIVDSAVYDDAADTTKLVCYDLLYVSMAPYHLAGVTYPISLKNYLLEVCSALDIEIANIDDLRNGEMMIQNDKYLNAAADETGSVYSYRDVLDDICKCAGCSMAFKTDAQGDNAAKLYIIYVTDGEGRMKAPVCALSIDNLKQLKIGEAYGPANAVILSREPQEDNVYLRFNAQDNRLTGNLAAQCAATYQYAKAVNNVQFIYSTSNIFSPSLKVTDANGKKRIDCSAFVGLCLRGIDYAHSPYAAHSSANAVWDPASELPGMYGTYGWEFRALDRQPPGAYNSIGIAGYSTIRTAADLAEYLSRHGSVVYDSGLGVSDDDTARQDEMTANQLIALLQPGDILFWSKRTNDAWSAPNRYRRISHTGIAAERTDRFFHVTTAAGNDFGGDNDNDETTQTGGVYYSSLNDENIDRMRELSIVIRPAYRGNCANKAPVGVNLFHFPQHWNALKSYTANGMTYTFDGVRGFDLNGTTPAGTVVTNTIKKLLLPPGKYTLGGMDGTNVAHVGVSLRVRDAGTGDDLAVAYAGHLESFELREQTAVDLVIRFGNNGYELNNAAVTPSLVMDEAYPDSGDVPDDALCEVKLANVQLVEDNGTALQREDWLPEIYKAVHGTKYQCYELESYGIGILNFGDVFTIHTYGKSGREIDYTAPETYTSVFMRTDLTITTGLNEKSVLELPVATSTDYKAAAVTEKGVKQAFLRVDKQIGEIQSLVNDPDTGLQTQILQNHNSIALLANEMESVKSRNLLSDSACFENCSVHRHYVNIPDPVMFNNLNITYDFTLQDNSVPSGFCRTVQFTANSSSGASGNGIDFRHADILSEPDVTKLQTDTWYTLTFYAKTVEKELNGEPAADHLTLLQNYMVRINDSLTNGCAAFDDTLCAFPELSPAWQQYKLVFRLTGEMEYFRICFYFSGMSTDPESIDSYKTVSVSSFMLTEGTEAYDWAARSDSLDGKLELCVRRDENDQIVSMLNASADVIQLRAGHFSINGNAFTVDSSGNVTIGGWTVSNNALYFDDLSSGTRVYLQNIDQEFGNDTMVVSVQRFTSPTSAEILGGLRADGHLIAYCDEEGSYYDVGETLYNIITALNGG